MGLQLLTFPDISDKTAIGKSGTKALASTGGAENVASTGNIAGSTGAHALTTPEMAAHTHPQGGGSINSPSNTPPGPKAGATPSNTGSAGGGDYTLSQHECYIYWRFYFSGSTLLNFNLYNKNLGKYVKLRGN